jgi:hypothetical protein
MSKLLYAIPLAAVLTAGWLMPTAPAGAAGREGPAVVREALGDPDDLNASAVHSNSTKCVKNIVSSSSTKCVKH